MRFDPRTWFKEKPPARPADFDGPGRYLAAWRANGGRPPRKPKSKAILLKELARATADFIVKNKNLTREEKLDLLDDLLLDAGVEIAKRLKREMQKSEDFPISDAMQMFKQASEYRVKEARVSKIDPKSSQEDGTPAGLKGYQQQLAENKAELAAAPPTPPEEPKERVAASTGQRDKRHDNEGRPPGASLAKRQEAIRKKQEKMRAAEEEDTPEAEEQPRGI